MISANKNSLFGGHVIVLIRVVVIIIFYNCPCALEVIQVSHIILDDSVIHLADIVLPQAVLAFI